MVNAVAPVSGLQDLSMGSITDPTQNNLNNVSATIDKIVNSSDLVSDISNNYNFLTDVMSGQKPINSVDDTLQTQKHLEDFSYETGLVSKAVGIGIQGINTLVKMQ